MDVNALHKISKTDTSLRWTLLSDPKGVRLSMVDCNQFDFRFWQFAVVYWCRGKLGFSGFNFPEYLDLSRKLGLHRPVHNLIICYCKSASCPSNVGFQSVIGLIRIIRKFFAPKIILNFVEPEVLAT